MVQKESIRPRYKNKAEPPAKVQMNTRSSGVHSTAVIAPGYECPEGLLCYKEGPARAKSRGPDAAIPPSRVEVV